MTTTTDLQTFPMEHAARERAGLPRWYCEVWAPGEQDRPRYVTRFCETKAAAQWDADVWVKSYLTRTTGT